MKIAIIGKGNVGSALARGLKQAGHDPSVVGKDQAAMREAATNASVVILAAPFSAINDIVKSVGGSLAGKTVIDVTNALDAEMNLALGFTTSGAEALQKLLPNSKVVKAFNTVFAQHMDNGRVGAEILTCFVAGDDPDAKSNTLALARAIGFDAVDAGPLKNARLLEPLGYLNIHMGYMLKMGTDIGFKFVGASKAASAHA